MAGSVTSLLLTNDMGTTLTEGDDDDDEDDNERDRCRWNDLLS